MSLIPKPLRGLRSRARVAAEGLLFDWRNGVNTSGVVQIAALSVLGNNGAFAVQYEPAVLEEVKSALQAVDVQHPEYTFIDFGSGKGRTLFVAAGYPYRKVMGVEFGKQLHDSAVRNIATFRGKRQCGELESVHADATEFAIPGGPLVIFLNNPFRDPVMQRVMANVARSLEAEPREMVFVCVTKWTLTKYIEQLPGVRQVATQDTFRIFRTNGGAN